MIIKDKLRIGKYTPFKNTHIIKYYHTACAFQSFSRARLKENVVSEPEQLDGYKDLTVCEQEIIAGIISKANNERKNELPDRPKFHKVRKKISQISKQDKEASKTKKSNLPTIKILFTNADQLTESKMCELVTKISQERPLIVAISEVKPKNSSKERQKEDYQIPNYSLHPINITNTIGRGMAVYTHESIKESVVEINLNTSFEEVCLLEIRLMGGDTMLFGCCYRSPTLTPTSNENNEKLNGLLKIISEKKYSHRCIVGDFNYRNINWTHWTTDCGDNSLEAQFLKTVRDSFFYQHIDEPTRARGSNNPSLIDLVFTDEEMQVSNVQYHEPLGKSDHGVIIFDYHCYLDYSEPKEILSYFKGDYQGMRNELDESKWTDEFMRNVGTMNIEELWTSLKEKLNYLKTRYVPKITTSKQPSWSKKGFFPISEPTLKALRTKRKLHRDWMSALKGSDGKRERLLYIKASKKVRSKIRKEKRKFERGIALEAKTNPKKFWAHTRRKLKTKVGVAPLLKDPKSKSSLQFDDHEKANILQRQFLSVFTKEPEGEIPRISKRCDKTILDIIVTEDMIRKLIEALNENKSIGPDGIHPKMVRELIDFLVKPLTAIFNLSLKSGTVPHDWKLANVSPIYKKGSRNLPENYRPISLTSIVCKMMESLIRNRIMEHLRDRNLLSIKQHGFISGRSTVTQLLNYIDKCTESISKGHTIDTVYLDFAKAFDTVPHKRLIAKLEMYGISGCLINWIRDYLSNRSQTVLVNGVKSCAAPVISGIPQGTCLGPLLFVVYINDLLDDITSDGFMFADDTKIFRQISSVNDSRHLQSDITKLENWSNKWLLQFHPDKCHILTLGKFENIKHTHRYTICNKEMEHVSEEKDLGVIIDSDLSFDEHISKKVRITNAIVGLIRRTFSYLDGKTFVKLYKAFVRPHLEYAQVIWSPHLKKHIDILENVQIRATKLVDGFQNLEYRERLQRLNLQTLAFRRLRGDIIEMHKHFHRYDKTALPDSFKPRQRTSRKHDFQIHELETKDGVRGTRNTLFYTRIAKVWNQLPADTVNEQNMNKFKKMLDNSLHNHRLKYDHKAITSDS